MGRLDGKVAIVTGSGNGMGKAEAIMLAREGAKVVVADLRDDDGHKTEAAINEAGGDAVFIHLDVTNEEDWQKLVDQAMARFGKINVLVNNAGLSSSFYRDQDSTEGWDHLMAVNAKGPFLGTKYVVPRMLEAGGGSIVNISSTSALVGSATGHPGYNASKAGLRLFTKAMAARLGKDNIRVNSVHPGRMPPMTTSSYSVEEQRTRKARWESTVPLRRDGRVEEVAYAVLFLASDESSYVTGVELPVDGGFTAI